MLHDKSLDIQTAAYVPMAYAHLLRVHAPTIAAEALSYHRSVTPNAVISLANLIETIPIFYWKTDLWSAAISECDIFVGHKLADHMPNPPDQLWLYDADLYQSESACAEMGLGPGTGENTMVVGAQVLVTSPSLLSIVQIYFALGDLRRGILVNCIPRIRSVGVSTDVTFTDARTAGIIGALEFMHLPIVTTHAIRPPRAERRRLQKLNRKIPEVHVVLLRRVAHGSEHIPTNKRHIERDIEKVEWNYQWVVRPHWRNQWYPSLGIHKPVFIGQYVKGPIDKPLKPKSKSVFAIVR